MITVLYIIYTSGVGLYLTTVIIFSLLAVPTGHSINLGD
jgi:hypothetical protein